MTLLMIFFLYCLFGVLMICAAICKNEKKLTAIDVIFAMGMAWFWPFFLLLILSDNDFGLERIVIWKKKK